ncbi:MAG: hypothetical protein Kow0069_20860 [Promethearchaeota archaeon]
MTFVRRTLSKMLEAANESLYDASVPAFDPVSTMRALDEAIQARDESVYYAISRKVSAHFWHKVA